MGCFIPYRRQEWVEWTKPLCGCDVFNDGSCIGWWGFDGSYDDSCNLHYMEYMNPYVPDPVYAGGFVGGCINNEIAALPRIEGFGFRPYALPITSTFWFKMSAAEDTVIKIGSVGNFTTAPRSGVLQYAWKYAIFIDKASSLFVTELIMDLSEGYPQEYYDVSASVPSLDEWHFFCVTVEATRITNWVLTVDGDIADEQSTDISLIEYPYLCDEQFLFNMDAHPEVDGSIWFDQYRMFSRKLSQEELYRLCMEDRELPIGGGGGR